MNNPIKNLHQRVDITNSGLNFSHFLKNIF